LEGAVREGNPTENGWASYPSEKWCASRMQAVDGGLWRHCAERYGGPILDLCCGSGAFAVGLARRGYEIVAVDFNPGMVDVARQWATREKLPITVIQADITRLELPRRFRLAILPGWSWQVLLTAEEQIAFLRGVHACLEPGGALALDIFMPINRQRGLIYENGKWIWPPNPHYHNGAARSFDPLTQIEDLKESNVHPVRVRHTTLGEFDLLFQSTGFRRVELFGDSMPLRPYTGGPDCDYAMVAEKYIS
jgi:SAM-dependent methyltransferase